MELNEKQLEMCTTSQWDFSDLNALFLNCTMKRSPEMSHTRGLIDISKAIKEKNGVTVEVLRPIDYDIATGVWPDMTEHGWEKDDWPEIYEKVKAAHILVLTSSIWLGEKTSVCTQVIERLYSTSGDLNEHGQYAYYGRVGGCLITGNEDGAKHCSMIITVFALTPGLCDPSTSRFRMAWNRWPRTLLPGSRIGRSRERLYQSKHNVHDLESDAHGPDDQRCRRHSGPRKSAVRLGGRLQVRLSQSRTPLTDSHRCLPAGPLYACIQRNEFRGYLSLT